MSAYEWLAYSYDSLTYDVGYEKVLEFMESILQTMGKSPKTVLDLACGTGSMSVLMAQRGYHVTGADLSQEMLMVAYEKALELKTNRPVFVCQPMQALELPFGVDWIVCCLDSLNYLTDPKDCQETLRRAYENLTPGGVLIFDINSPAKLRGLDGQVFLDETENAYCVWRASYEPVERICYYGIDLFQRDGKVWQRSFEEHAEYAYTVEELAQWLRRAGFKSVFVYGDRTMQAPAANEQRIYFTAIKE